MEAKGVRFLAYQSIFSSVGSGDFDGVKKLVEEVKKEEGSSLSDVMSLQNDAGETALYIAAENNLQEMFSFLLSICHFEVVKIRSKADMNAFHVAAKRGNLDIVRELLNIWPEVCKLCDSSNTSPLYSAAVQDHLDVVDAILDVDVSSMFIVRKNGKTSLHNAARYGVHRIVKTLIARDPGIVCIKDKKRSNCTAYGCERTKYFSGGGDITS